MELEYVGPVKPEDLEYVGPVKVEEPSWSGVLPRAVANIVTSPFYMAKEIGKDIIRIPRNIARIGEIEPREFVRSPTALPRAIAGSVSDIVVPLAEASPEIAAGIAGSPAGIPGVIASQILMRGGRGISRGELPQETTQAMIEAGGTTGLFSYAPAAYRYAKKLPGRYASLPGERHAAAAEALGEIPGRFGVDDALVSNKYAVAERLASQPPQGTAPLGNLIRAISRMDTQIQANPLASLRESPLAKQVATLNREVTQLGRDVSAGEVNAIIKGINDKIGSTAGPERGTWKQMLGAVHEDMRAAATSTRDPAFQAYADAIRTARLNFLKQDIEEAIAKSGIKEQRTGASLIAAPGNVKRWIRLNSEWQKAVEKAQPGLLDSIRADIEEIIPIANYKAQGIPGQQFGSGRLLIGAALGRLLQRTLGLPPGTAEAVGALIGGLSPLAGIKLTPDYIRRSFRPTVKAGSWKAGTVGGVYAEKRDEGERRYVPEQVMSAIRGRAQHMQSIPMRVLQSVYEAVGGDRNKVAEKLRALGYDPEAPVE